MTKEKFQSLVDVVHNLRKKCPWDMKQTNESLRPLTIEELYELIDAIDNKDEGAIKEELGDILLHVIFYSILGEKKETFSLDSVLENITEKLIRRHPHIYGDAKAKNEEEVMKNWEKIKQSEKKKSVLEGVPKALPAVMKALTIQAKAKKVGFEWKEREDVLAKVKEELDELDEALHENDTKHTHEEMGDVLFSIINYSRFINIDPEAALASANNKFMARFQAMEQLADKKGLDFLNLDLNEMDGLWNEVKKSSKEA